MEHITTGPQRIQERLDSTADLVVAALQDKFLDIEKHLAELAGSPDSNLAEALGLDESEIGKKH